MLADLRYRIQAIVFSRSKCEDKITDLSCLILDRIIMVLAFEHARNGETLDELNSLLVDVWEVEPKGFKLKETDYYTWLFSEKKAVQGFEIFEKYVRGMFKPYRHLPRLHSDQEVFERLPAIYKAIASELAKGDIPDASKLIQQ